jgi:hypothetical protein
MEHRYKQEDMILQAQLDQGLDVNKAMADTKKAEMDLEKSAIQLDTARIKANADRVKADAEMTKAMLGGMTNEDIA